MDKHLKEGLENWRKELIEERVVLIEEGATMKERIELLNFKLNIAIATKDSVGRKHGDKLQTEIIDKIYSEVVSLEDEFESVKEEKTIRISLLDSLIDRVNYNLKE